MPRQKKEPRIPEKEVGEEGDGKNIPGEGAPPRGQGQNPGAIPGMKDRTQDERRAERPKHPAFPVSPKQK